ncbi:MAG: 2-dehydropantoate 2-reductase [Alphaproteobacteria bacterium]|nr:2-dehydropantoate 2-reductase [Alphaproteobacteria bacterium]
MKIAVLGVGGVGGPIGAALAVAGHDVTLIARGAHLDAIRKDGLRIDGAKDVHAHPVRATDTPASVGPVDAVLLAVKAWAVEEAGALILPMLRDGTAVIALQNGVEAEDRLGRLIGPEHVMGGIAEIAAAIHAPSVIRQVSDYTRIRFGEMDGSDSPRGRALDDAFRATGIESEFTRTIERTIWTKFLMLAAVSGLTSATRGTFGAVRSDPDTRALLCAAVAEVAAVGVAKGVALDDDCVDRTMAWIDTLPAQGRASMATDLDRGNRLELPWLSGAVVRLGGDLGVPTPVHGFICAVLKFHQDGAQP